MLYQCGDEVCGRVSALDEPLDDSGKAEVDRNNPDESLQGRPILGMDLLTEFSSKKAGSYRGDMIYSPRNGKLYKAILTLLDDGALQIRGYVGLPALGQTQVWTRSAE